MQFIHSLGHLKSGFISNVLARVLVCDFTNGWRLQPKPMVRITYAAITGNALFWILFTYFLKLYTCHKVYMWYRVDREFSVVG